MRKAQLPNHNPISNHAWPRSDTETRVCARTAYLGQGDCYDNACIPIRARPEPKCGWRNLNGTRGKVWLSHRRTLYSIREEKRWTPGSVALDAIKNVVTFKCWRNTRGHEAGVAAERSPAAQSVKSITPSEEWLSRVREHLDTMTVEHDSTYILGEREKRQCPMHTQRRESNQTTSMGCSGGVDSGLA